MYRRRLLMGSDSKAASYIAPTAKSLAYNGFSQALINAGSTDDGVIEYSTDNSTWSEIIPSGTNAGSYDVYWRLVADTAHTSIPSTSLGAIEIEKATPTVIAPTAKVLTYNGSAQELVDSGSTDFGTLQYKISNESWSTTIPTRTRGGSYVVQYRVVGDSNISDVPAESINCSINEKPVTVIVTLSQNEYTYNGNGCEPSVTVQDGATVIDPSEYTVTYSNNINVGTATVTINDNTGGDYNVIGSTTFTIVKVTPTVTAPTAKVLTYNGSPQELVNAASTDFGTLQYSLDDNTYTSSIPSGTNATSYTVYYKVIGDSNINDVAAQTVNASIGKANGRVDTSPTAKSLTYNTSAQELITAGSGTGTMMYKLDEGSWDTTIPSGTNATSYTVYYKASASTNYNESSSGSVNCSISKANSSLSFNITGVTINVTDTSTNAVTVNVGDGTVTYSSNNTSAVTVDNNGTVTGVGIGDAIITANISETNNYNSASTTYTVSSILLLTTKYNATSTTENTMLLYRQEGTSNFLKQYIDGVEQTSIQLGYTFNTTGLHTVEYSLKKPKAGGLFAFYNCPDLVSVDIPNGVTEIDSFMYCSGLTSVTIPDSVTKIYSSAFTRCYALTSVTIPSSMTTIGEAAFSYCRGLRGTVTIPSGVTTINNSTFNGCSGLTSIILSNNVTTIGSYAFSGCKGLTSFTIPDSVTSIGGSAFEDCNGIRSIVIPSGVISIEAWTFDFCTSLTSVTLPNTITVVGHGSFRQCTSLSSMTIPDSVTSINNLAFQNCTSLSSVTIGSGLTSIGDSAFTYCSGLTTIVVDSNNTTYDSRDNCNAIIETSTNNLVYGCKTTVIPNTVTSIGKDAFYGCIRYRINDINIPDSVTSIGSSAFADCTGLENISIPDSVTSIGYNAFIECFYLKTCTIGSGITTIGSGAFWNCSGLTTVNVGSGLTSIENQVFYNCKNLKKINSSSNGAFNLPDGITSIGNWAFHYCRYLTSVIIPSGVTSIGENAFSSDNYLASITCNATVAPTIQSTTFSGVETNGTLYVPQGSSGYDAWMSTDDYYLGKYNWTKIEQ